MTKTPDITFVCCVESGSLESQTIRMVESLRKYGGKFANAPIFAVTPRFGPPLSKKTIQVFEKLKITYLHSCIQTNYSWYNFLNKPLALVVAEEHIKSEMVAWLDSDLLIINEPSDLVLQSDESFLACSPDQSGGTTGLNHPMEIFWQYICSTLNLDIESLPWVITEIEKARIRYYFNSGVFVYRRQTDFSQQYLKNCIKMLDANIFSKLCGFFFTEQITVGLTAFQLGLPWRSLPFSHNYSMGSKSLNLCNKDSIKNASIVHYHDSMWHPVWPIFIDCFENTHPEIANWLSSLGPIINEAPLQWRLVNKILNYYRNNQANNYKKNCRII